MAARAFTRIPRASPNLFPSRVVHRCILPVAGKLNAGIVSDEGRREKLEKRQIGGSADGRPNALMSQARNIHMTRRSENTVIMAGLGIAASAMAARYGLQAYNNWKVYSIYSLADFNTDREAESTLTLLQMKEICDTS